MNKTAKRILTKIYRYLALIDVVIPAHDKDELEKIITEELERAFLDREENE